MRHVVAIALGAVCAWVGNAWAFLGLVPLAAAAVFEPAVPRIRWLFWALYPLHLALLWCLARWPASSV